MHARALLITALDSKYIIVFGMSLSAWRSPVSEESLMTLSRTKYSPSNVFASFFSIGWMIREISGRSTDVRITLTSSLKATLFLLLLELYQVAWLLCQTMEFLSLASDEVMTASHTAFETRVPIA